MYDAKFLSKFPFFKKHSYKYILDSLTGTVTRGVVLDYAKKLISDKHPFGMIIIDIDNFKSINDGYGHRCGDLILVEFAQNLMEFVGDNGLVGRYGGDEFIIILDGKYDYDRIRAYLVDLYGCNKIIRRDYFYNDKVIPVTGTVGCTLYPKDADNYDELFMKMDKTLYRGKIKGRNCFIIYVDEKHRDINVHDKDASSLSIMFKKINNLLAINHDLPKDKLIKKLLVYVKDAIGLNQVVFVTPDRKVISSLDKAPHKVEPSCIELLDSLCDADGLFVPLNISLLREESKTADEFLTSGKILTFMMDKVSYEDKVYGYILFFETMVERIWQDNNIALILFMNRVIYEILSKK